MVAFEAILVKIVWSRAEEYKAFKAYKVIIISFLGLKDDALLMGENRSSVVEGIVIGEGGKMSNQQNETREKKIQCSICGMNPVSNKYPNMVCRECDRQALTINKEKARHADEDPNFCKYVRENNEKTGIMILPSDDGDNPVFINSIKCWRRYRFGGWITMKDEHDCQTLKEFYRKHFPNTHL